MSESTKRVSLCIVANVIHNGYISPSSPFKI